MINLDLGGNGDLHSVTEDVVNDAIQTLENPLQKVEPPIETNVHHSSVSFVKNLVLRCLEIDPLRRPTARDLLFHPALFEVPSLKLLSVHSLADDIRQSVQLALDAAANLSSLGLKPDRSFVSPIVQSVSNEQIFAESEPIRDGVKPVMYT